MSKVRLEYERIADMVIIAIHDEDDGTNIINLTLKEAVDFAKHMLKDIRKVHRDE